MQNELQNYHSRISTIRLVQYQRLAWHIMVSLHEHREKILMDQNMKII